MNEINQFIEDQNWKNSFSIQIQIKKIIEEKII